MNGEWIVLIWAFVSVIFLVKIPAIKEFFAKVRKMSAIGIICMMLSLGFLANMSYTKDGVNTNQSTSQTVSLSAENLSSLTQSSISARTGLPDFWKDDPTDTDGDGIPDLWEKWTHGKKLVADSDLDRDGDSLTDLEEFQNQTDPRTADTDGDTFSDFFEVANSMNPVVSEDFTSVEPDLNNNGLPDLWELGGYDSSFQDADHNGFDDTYERYYLPAASDGNFDVLVDIYSTRSVLLVWESGEDWNSIVMLPSTSTSVKLRLPFDVDTAVRLLPAPYGIDPPSGELWKTRMSLSFVPRTGQGSTRTCIIGSNGDVLQKVAGLTTLITRFPDPESSMQTMSMDSGAGEWPMIDILRRRYSLIPDAGVYHASGDVVGPFEIWNAVNINAGDVIWSVDYGEMSPTNGLSSSLTVTDIPPNHAPIILTATVQLDDDFSIIRTATVDRCPRHGFSLDSHTVNFSPHLSETFVTSVTLPGCVHQNDPGWLEIEVMRETTEGWQHVAWIDTDPSTPGVDRYGDAMQLPSHPIFSWDGIATEGAAAAESPAVFAAGTTSFHRALPEVVSGEPVPPPYYTIFVRLWNSGEGVIHEESHQTYVPQVVRIQWDTEGYDAFNSPYSTPGIDKVCMYKRGESPLSTFSSVLPSMIQTAFSEVVNIRITSDTVQGKHKLLTLNGVGTSIDCGVTHTEGKIFFRNVDVDGTCEVRIKNNIKSVYNAYVAMILNDDYPEPFNVPINEEVLLLLLARSAAHEIGHTLGLVAPPLGGSQRLHNKPPHDQDEIMLPGSSGYLKWRMAPLEEIDWRPVNKSYLEFILPKGN